MEGTIMSIVQDSEHRKLSASPLDIGNSTLIVVDTVPGECVAFKLHENPLEPFKSSYFSSGG